MRVAILALALLFHGLAEAASIRVGAWNTANHPNTSGEGEAFALIFEAMGHIDLLVLAETDKGSIAAISEMLGYRSEFSSPGGNGDRTGFVYDPWTLSLDTVGEIRDGLTHPSLVGTFRPHATGESINVYAVHLKSSNEPEIRGEEAARIRNHADRLPQGSNVLLAGDFNMYGSDEPAWDVFTAPGPAEAFDAAEAPGQWRNKEEFIRLHTQHTRDGPREGGMDDRFDLVLASTELTDGAGIEYVADSFRVFGNNGTHKLNGPIDTGSGAEPHILAALTEASDHLPVLAEFRFPTFWPGDADTDGDFDRFDLIQVLNAGKYLTSSRATWGEGDWNSDRHFGQLDVVAALAAERYGNGSAAHVVPEPGTFALFIFGFCAGFLFVKYLQKTERTEVNN